MVECDADRHGEGYWSWESPWSAVTGRRTAKDLSTISKFVFRISLVYVPAASVCDWDWDCDCFCDCLAGTSCTGGRAKNDS